MNIPAFLFRAIASIFLVSLLLFRMAFLLAFTYIATSQTFLKQLERPLKYIPEIYAFSFIYIYIYNDIKSHLENIYWGKEFYSRKKIKYISKYETMNSNVY